MSKGPTGATGSDLKGFYRVNVYFSKKDYCRYDGECKIYQTLIDEDLCNFCIYQDKFNVPRIVDDALTEREKEDGL